MTQLDQFVRAAKPEFERKLSRLVAVRTVSTDPDRAEDIRQGAEVAVELLSKAGLKARAVPTAGNPVVIGKLVQDPGYKTVLIYNHLDVQPAEGPEWKTDPFSLTITGDKYFGRGATDDKGPALSALMALEYAVAHQIPLNFLVVWEFEEEIGSPHFEAFLQAHNEELKCDSVLVSDTIWLAAGIPAIPTGLRGMMAFEVTVRTGAGDVHSGLAGGAARNPLGELAQIISALHDATTGKVNVPGFYDDVVPPTPTEVRGFVESGFSVRRFMADHALTKLRTTDTEAVVSRIMAEPTFEVHGITGGYTGPGVKAIIPGVATAKLSTRLVPNQDPVRVFDLIRQFIVRQNPDAQVQMEAGLDPYLEPVNGPYARAAKAACTAAFGSDPALVREGGSIGAVISFKRHLDVPIMLLGLSLPAHGYHAPNEYFDWGQAGGGIKLFGHYFGEIARL